MELFLTLLPGLIIMVTAFAVLLHISIKNKREEKTLIKYDPEKNSFRYKTKIFFIKQIKIFCILGIFLIAFSIIYPILSRTVLREFIENHNNRIIEEALVVKNETYQILETIHNVSLEIEFNRVIRRSTNLSTSVISGIYEFNIFRQNIKENIRVEWELIEGEVAIKSITKHIGREVINIFSPE